MMKYFSKFGLVLIVVYIIAVTLLIMSEPISCRTNFGQNLCPAVVDTMTNQQMFLVLVLLPGLLLMYGTSGNIGNIIPQVPIVAILINIFILYLVGFTIERIFMSFKNRKVDINLVK